ncbi:MAG TPA: radical SAM protein [Thermoanaerobaculia bacterium]
MTFQIPRLITLDVGRPSAGRQTKREPLCIDEMLSLAEELADLGVARMRLLLHDVSAIDDLERLTAYARRRRCAVTVVCRTHADAASIGAIAEAMPNAIAIPLHSHTADIHKLVDGGIDWSWSVHLATAVHETGIPLEIETAITPGNALPLMPLSEVVESLHAASWHLDFSHARLSDAITTSAATALIHIAARGRLRVSVHELPFLRQIVRQHTVLLPLLMMTDAAEAMHVSSSGDVRVNDIIVGNVRVQTFDTIQERSRSYVVSGIPDAGLRVVQPCRRSEFFQ